MNKLDELILVLCPDGVEYIEIEKVFDIKNGYTPSKANNDFWENGTIPWFRMDDIRTNGRVLSNALQQITPIAVKNKLFPADSLIMSTLATIGEHALVTVPFLANQQLTCLSRKESYLGLLDPKYIFHWGFILSKWCKENTNIASFASVDMQKFKNVLIPIPPIPVQQEIVRILDQFTELTTELTTELALRKKQYDYYRNELLTFDGVAGVEYVKIKNAYTRLKGTSITAEKMKQIDKDDGEIRIFAGGKTMVNACAVDIPNLNVINVPSVLVQSRGVIDAIYYDKPFTFKNEMWAYTSDVSVSVKYLYHVLKNNIEYFRNAAAGMGSLPQISLPVTEDFEIPIPPLAEQQRIVDILDRFDALCNDLSSGLPAEINARKKQYEYYRDTLLSFEEKVAGVA